MKFLFLSGHAHLALDPSSAKASGGAELQVALLARELVGRSHEAVLLGADTGQRDGEVWEAVKVRVGGRYDTGALGDTVRALPRILSILREERPDYVVVYGWTAWLYLLCHLRQRTPFRLVFVCALDAEIDGGFRRENPLRGFLFERGMKLADARLAITEYQARLFREKGMSCQVTRLLLQDREFASGEGKTVDLLWVARCHPVKRPALFLDLAERFPQLRCRMICSVQDRPLWESIQARASKLANVEFLERVPYRDIQAHFNASRIFVNTSASEGVPNTFIHSGLGRTAIASLAVDPDGMFEVFGAGICASGHPEKLTRTIAKWMADAAALRRAQDECARFVREWHDNTHNVNTFLAGL